MDRSSRPSQRTYWWVFAALALLLVATLAADRFHFGAGNLAVALAIATAKAVLIAAYFMHLKASAATVRFAAGAGLLWLAVLMTLAMSDYLTRGWKEPGSGQLAEQQLPETYDAGETGEFGER